MTAFGIECMISSVELFIRIPPTPNVTADAAILAVFIVACAKSPRLLTYLGNSF